jgi:hypothetical protein
MAQLVRPASSEPDGGRAILIGAYLTFIFIVRTLQFEFRYFLISCSVLFIASPLPFFASFLMPDVFAGYLILGFAILVTSWNRLSIVERTITGGVLLFAVLAHPTHLILLAAMAAVTLSFQLALSRRSQWISIRWLITVVLICIVVAISMESAFYYIVSRTFGDPPVRPPFVTAKLVSMLGEPELAKVCGSNAFVVCRFKNRSPIDNDRFLWSENQRFGVFSVVDSRTKRLLSDEQFRFALAIIPPNLGRVASSVSQDALRQLTSVGLSEFSYSPNELRFFKDHLPNDYYGKLMSTLGNLCVGF